MAVVNARAQTREASVALGKSLLGLRDVLGTQTELRVNGNQMFASGTHADEPAETVLDRVEAHCRSRGWQLSEKESLPIKTLVQAAAGEWGSYSLTLSRQRAAKGGAITCLLAPEGMQGVSHLLARAKAAVETGDLGTMGQFRYVFARENAAGGSDVVTVWTEGHFSVKDLLPTEHDCPGSDLPGVSRPPGLRRAFDVMLGNGQYGLKSYMTLLLRGSTSSPFESYGSNLEKAGWQRSRSHDNGHANTSEMFVKNGAALLLSSTIEGTEQRIDLLQMGSNGFADVSGTGIQ